MVEKIFFVQCKIMYIRLFVLYRGLFGQYVQDVRQNAGEQQICAFLRKSTTDDDETLK